MPVPVDDTKEEPRRPAAASEAGTLLLLREGGAGPEVLMVRRGRKAAFMADAYVFPGGRIEPGEPHGAAGAAAREAFEEAGVLLAVPADAPPGTPPISTDNFDWVAAARRDIHQKKITFAELLNAHGLRLAVEEMVYFARWVTPSSEPRRFDAHFFLARMPVGQTPGHDAVEVTEHRWGTGAELLAANARGDIKLPPPTFWHLSDLSQHGTVDAALAWARSRRVRTVQPKLVAQGMTLAVVLPWAADFDGLPGEGERISVDDPIAGPVTRFVLDDGRWVPH